MPLTRRSCLTGTMAALSLAGCAQSVIVAEPNFTDPSLDELAQRKGLRFGAAVGQQDMADPAIRAILARECGILGAENAFKWKRTQPRRNEFTYTDTSPLMHFANQNNIQVRGHALVWTPDKNMPKWTRSLRRGDNVPVRAKRLMRKHINSICNHFGTSVATWDVVNEAIQPGNGEYASGVFLESLGPEYIDLAFHLAREAAPHAKLVYNDYMRWSDKQPNHHIGVLKLLERLKMNNVPIDALGIQAHLRRFPDTENDLHWRNFLNEVSEMGYEILLTELDVRDKGLSAQILQRDQQISDHVRHFLDITLDNLAVKEVHTWGISDKYTVRQTKDTRTDGLSSRPLPYDQSYRAKPMRHAIAAAFNAAPER